MERPVLAPGVVLRNRGARLQCVDDDAVVTQLEARHICRAGKGGGDLLAVPEMEIEPDIPRHVIIKQRCPG